MYECLPKSVFPFFRKRQLHKCPLDAEQFEATGSTFLDQENFSQHLNFPQESKDGLEAMLEAVSVLAILIFFLLNTKYHHRKALIPRLLAIIWVCFGFKYFLDRVTFTYTLGDSITLLSAIFSILIGLMLYINFYDLLQARANASKKSFFSNLKSIASSLLLNYNFTIFDVDQLNALGSKSEEIKDDTFLSYLYSFFYYIMIGLNNLPLLCNYLVKKRFYNLPLVLFPSPLSICSFTLFLSLFRNNMNNSYFLILNGLCYSIIIMNMVYEIYVLKMVSFEHYFFIILCVATLLLKYGLGNFFTIFGINTIVEKTFHSDYSLVIFSHTKPEGGVQGFLGRIFKCDRFGILADVIMMLTSDGNTMVDPFTRDVTLDAQHVRLVYPNPRNILY